MNIQNALLLSEVVVSKEPFQDPASSLSLFDDKKELKAHYQNIVLRSKQAAFNEMFTKGEKRSFASLNEEKGGRKTLTSLYLFRKRVHLKISNELEPLFVSTSTVRET